MKLTNEQIKQTGLAMIAFSEGKKVEAAFVQSPNSWHDVERPNWHNEAAIFRPKPQPVSRHWRKPEDGGRAMKKSAFGQWFVAQHGKRPARGGTDCTLSLTVIAALSAERELQARHLYDARKQSALYAWTAKDKPEREILKQIKK